MSSNTAHVSESAISAPASPLLKLSAAQMQCGLRARDFSVRDLVSASLIRSHEVDKTLNAFCQIFDDEAMEKATEKDRSLRNGETIGLLHGIPLAVKDLTPTKGHLTSCGSWSLGDWVPDHTALCVERLEQAGAIIIGKTTTPEFAFSAFTRSPRWGTTRNPWNPTRTSGGSSGGSAVAVATGCVPFAEGTDMGGSIRIPAACCGVVGLKPSLGRIPMTILPSVFDNISHFGPIAKSVSDADMFLQIAAGSSDQDINSLTQPYDLSRSSRKSALSGQRFAYSLDQGYYMVENDIADAFGAALDALRSAGAIVERADLAWSREINDRWYDYWCVNMAAFYGHLLAEYVERMDANVVAGIEHGRALSGVQFKSIELLRTSLWQDLARVFSDYDSFLTPTCAIEAPPADRNDTAYVLTTDDGRYAGFEMTCVFNFLSACPVISLPIGMTSSGLPVGMQLAGRRNQDETLLSTARSIESLVNDSGLWRSVESVIV